MQKSMIEYKYNKNLGVEMYNYNKIIDQLEAMSPAHQDKYYTDTEAMNASLESRGHVGFDQGRKLVAEELGI